METINKNQKLDNFFKTTQVSGNNKVQSSVSSITNEIKDDHAAPSTFTVSAEVVPDNEVLIESDSVSANGSCENKCNLLDLSTWAPLKSVLTDYIIKNLLKHCPSIRDCDFSKSKCEYTDTVRSAKEHMFFTPLQNGELKKREWLMYSNTSGCVYCVPCKLFQPLENELFL